MVRPCLPALHVLCLPCLRIPPLTCRLFCHLHCLHPCRPPAHLRHHRQRPTDEEAKVPSIEAAVLGVPAGGAEVPGAGGPAGGGRHRVVEEHQAGTPRQEQAGGAGRGQQKVAAGHADKYGLPR